MANFIGSDIKAIYSDTINKLRQDIGRNVLVVGEDETRLCSNCSWDPIKKMSSGRFSPDSPYPSGIAGPTDFNALGLRHCPVCGGKGVLTLTQNRRNVLCLVNALAAQDAEATPLGKNYRRNYELSATIDNEPIFKAGKAVVIDGMACQIVAIIPAGIGDLTQITVYAGA